eukprot:403372943
MLFQRDNRLDKKLNNKFEKFTANNVSQVKGLENDILSNRKNIYEKDGTLIQIDIKRRFNKFNKDISKLNPKSQQINETNYQDSMLISNDIEESQMQELDEFQSSFGIKILDSNFNDSQTYNDTPSKMKENTNKKSKNSDNSSENDQYLHQKGKRLQVDYKTMKSVFKIQKNESGNVKNNAIIQQEISEISLVKLQSLENLIKHFFKHHLFQDTEKDYKIHILRIYYTMKVLKNTMLSHFLLFDLVQSLRNVSFIKRNHILIHQKYFQNQLNEHNQKNQLINQVSLLNMIDLNHLVSNFESKMENLASEVQKFWKNLVHEKQSFEIYRKGLNISKGLNSLSELYEVIQDKQGGNKEIKVFILMSGFYKYVVSKPQECMEEIQKSRLVYQTKKISNLTNENDTLSDKGLIIANLSLNKPMQIDFINKSCSRLIHYSQIEAQGLKINQLMPFIIGENHHLFLDKFMATGKNGMLNQRRDLFIKKKNGYVFPAITYLSINTHNLSNMVLIIEPNTSLSFFQEDQEDENVNSKMVKNSNEAFMITDNIFRMYEMTQEATLISYLSNDVLSSIKDSIGIHPQIDDLFYMTNQNCDIASLIKHGEREFDVQIKSGVNQLIQEYIMNQEAEMMNLENSVINNQNKHEIFNNQRISFQENYNQQYTMRVISQYYMNGGFQIYILSLKLLNSNLSTEKAHNQDSFRKFRFNQASKVSFSQTNLNQVKEARQVDYSLNKSEDLLEEDMEQYDLSSQTSTTSSSTLSSQKFNNKYSSSIKNQKIPLTLKLIFYIMLTVFLIIITTSSVSLSLTLSNTSDTREGIEVCRVALRRLNRLSSIRVIYRQIFNMAQNYVPSESEAIPDRFTFYSRYVIQLTEELRLAQVQLQKYDYEVEKFSSPVQLKFLQEDNTILLQERDLGQAVNLFINRADDLIKRGLQHGKEYFTSSEFYFVFSHDFKTKSKLIERDGFFIIENGNQDLFQKLLYNAQLFNQIKEERIIEKANFSSIMTWICISILCLCGLVSIPLFSQIQSRIFKLMKIFFNIDKSVVSDIQERLIKFNTLIKPATLQYDQQLIQQNYNDDQESIEKHQKSNLKNNNQQAVQGQYENQRVEGKINNEEGKEEENENIEIKSVYQIDEVENSSYPDKIERARGDIRIEKVSNYKKLKRHRIKKLKNRFDIDEELQDEEIQQQSQQGQSIQINSQLQYFNIEISKRKLRQSMFIVLITLAFNAYFLGTYLMSTKVFNEAAQSIDLTFAIQLRKLCVENVIHATTETILFNRTYLINNKQDEIQGFFNKFCSNIEKTYLQKVKRDRPAFFDGLYSYLDLLESGNYCETVFGDGSDDDGFSQEGTYMDVSKCQTIANGISKQGISQLYQFVYQMTNQIQLEYANQYKKDKAQNLAQMIQFLQKPVNLFDVIEILLQKPNSRLYQEVQSNLDEYFNKQELNFIMIYFVFILITVVAMAVFLLSKFYLNVNNFSRCFQKTQERNDAFKQAVIYYQF